MTTIAQRLMHPTHDVDHPSNPGWSLFEASGSMDNKLGDRPSQLQRWDGLGVFESGTQVRS